ncbi:MULTISPECIES: DUF1496 domain-containing protein [unclassified Brenneria]|uniref:DUF1496 domain-containing protein n=1 Tax=unclassified Brenneria TaxID=2634434 RepID=UPI0018F0A633|nr:DUF1496 domain-containing protein [Brenneria sp. L3-3C-1]MBJ7220728.1 YnjH family protein [Brenneria sp. L3-3C-1]MEE3641970.1 DUF1496 domain-containing protein [Brenneria sp. L3_3C_1]
MRSLVCWFISAAVLTLSATVQANPNRGATDIVVPVPAEAWGAGSATRGQNNCMRCCVYENRNYSEGAVLKIDGVILQCVRDKQTLGTNNLIWQPLKQ